MEGLNDILQLLDDEIREYLDEYDSTSDVTRVAMKLYIEKRPNPSIIEYPDTLCYGSYTYHTISFLMRGKQVVCFEHVVNSLDGSGMNGCENYIEFVRASIARRSVFETLEEFLTYARKYEGSLFTGGLISWMSDEGWAKLKNDQSEQRKKLIAWLIENKYIIEEPEEEKDTAIRVENLAEDPFYRAMAENNFDLAAKFLSVFTKSGININQYGDVNCELLLSVLAELNNIDKK